MRRHSRIATPRLLLAAFSLLVILVPRLSGQAASTIRQLRVLGSKNVVEIEIEASDGIVPQTQVLTGPYRLVIDFANAVPGSQLRSQSVNRGEVKDVRVGRFQARPPVTRIVLDLQSPQSYRVFPYGRTVMVKVVGNSSVAQSAVPNEFPPLRQGRASLVSANYTTSRERIKIAPTKPLEVIFQNGLLTIHSNKAALSDVLSAVRQGTGADIAIPPGADQEKVVANLGPGPAQEVLAHLLNGSRFNFLILNAASDPLRLDRVILTPRPDPSLAPLLPLESTADSAANAAASDTPPPDVAPEAEMPHPPFDQNAPPEANVSDQ